MGVSFLLCTPGVISILRGHRAWCIAPGAENFILCNEAGGCLYQDDLPGHDCAADYGADLAARQRHGVRVKVNMTHGNQLMIANTAVVGVRPTPRVISGQLSPADAQAVFRWIALNTDALVAHREGRIDTARTIQALNRRRRRHRAPRAPGPPH
jgi:hypothetical protein